MSRRLIRMMDEKIAREGSRGRSALAMAVGRGDRMIDRYMKGETRPRPEQIVKLAVACGCNEKEAHQLVLEGLTQQVQRTG